MKSISIDIETYSSINLARSGVYRYAESEDFEILLFAYSVDGQEVEVIDLANGEEIPENIIEAIKNDKVTKWAFNAMFERICLSKFLGLDTGEYLNTSSWKCSMIWSAYMGLPLSLEGVGTVLGLERQKITEGRDLIRYFCIPCKATKVNQGRTRNLPKHDLEKWKRFKEYNARDVETEILIQEKLSKFPVPDFIWSEYKMDQTINDRGIAMDMDFVKQAIAIDELSSEKLMAQMKSITGLENPNSVQQMKNWLNENGIEMDSLAKKEVSEMIEKVTEPYKTVLELRQKLAKSSIRKYAAMENVVCKDGRARGMFQFYGANRTGRFSGRLIQLQNLPRNHISDLEEVRSLIKGGNTEALDLLYEDVPDTLSQLIRTSFIPREGKKFLVADFSAIEARVIAWLANEKWRIDVFAGGGDIYCASASHMFNLPVERNGINGHLREKGKIAELALGYGGSIGALKSMGALDMGLEEEELQPLVNVWRRSNPNITKLWWGVDRAAKTCVKQRKATQTHGINFIYQSGMMFIVLPSGRKLAYVKPRMGENKFGGEAVTYEGVGGTKKWERIESYGPKFVENIVQAISRDILCYAMKTLKNYYIVAHVHDELVIEADMDDSLSEVCEEMSKTPSWAKGLLLDADGFECMFYQKD